MGSLLAVSLKSCRTEPILKKGGGCCAPVGGVCLSQQQQPGFDIKKSVSMLQRGDTAHFTGADTQTELVTGRYSSRMDREILQLELTCQLVRGIAGYNGEYDT